MTRSFIMSRFLVVLLMVSPLGVFIPMPAHALGLSPPTVEIDSLLRGTTQTREVRLYRAPDDVGNVYIHVEPDTKSAEFFVLEDTDIVMSDGQSEIAYEFGITPGDAANGSYELKLRFLKTADPRSPSGGTGVSIVTGVTAQILVTVGGEERLEYQLVSVSAQPTEEGLDAPVSYIISNTGNVDWQPQKIVFSFFNIDGERVGEYTLASAEIEPVKAGQGNQEFTVHIPIELTRGAYTVQAAFFDGDKETGTLESAQPFDVLSPGSLAQSGTLKGLSTNKSEFAPGEKVKLSGTFQNDGEVGLTAVLVSEISRDGQILDLVRGNEVDVEQGDEFVFSQFLDVPEEGSYEVSSYVEYGKKQTPVRQVTFAVRKQSGSLGSAGKGLFSIPNSFIGLVVISVGAILAVLITIVLRRRKNEHQPVASIPVSTQPSLSIPPQTPPQSNEVTPTLSASPAPLNVEPSADQGDVPHDTNSSTPQ